MPLGVTEGLFQKVTKCKNNPPVALRRQPPLHKGALPIIPVQTKIYRSVSIEK